MAEYLITPYDDGEVVSLSNTLFRKKILPKGTINYKGRKIVFDDAYFANLTHAFNDAAYDQVAAQLANDENKHTMDPTRFGGEIKGLEVTADGLYGTFELSADAAELVKKNPKLGVSASIRENYERADGKTYPAAMGHALLTLDPRIPGLGAWTEVSLSGYDSDASVIDLTDSSYEGIDTMPEQTVVKSLDDLTEEEIDAMSDDDVLALLAAEEAKATPPAPAATQTADAEKEKVPAMALSNDTDDKDAINLANQQALRNDVQALKERLATAQYEKDRDAYVSAGVPLALVELAQPLLAVADPMVIELSNDKSVDATAVARKMLDSMAGFVKLAQEKGGVFDFANETDDGATTDEDDAMIERMKAAGL